MYYKYINIYIILAFIPIKISIREESILGRQKDHKEGWKMTLLECQME